VRSIPAHISALRSEAGAAFRADDHEQMTALLEQAWAHALQEDDPGVCAQIAHAASDLFARAEMPNKALQMATAAVSYKRQEGSTDIFLGNYLGFLAKLLGRLERAEEALVYGKQAVVIFANYFGPEHYETNLVIGMCVHLERQAKKERTEDSTNE